MSSESIHSLTEATEPPDIIPCYNGEEVDIDKDIINACLTSISFKHTPVVNETTKKPDENTLFSERNSFIDIHRPEMTKVPAAPKSAQKIKQYFKDEAVKFGITIPNESESKGLNSEPQETDHIRWLLQARDSFSSTTEGTLSSEATEDRIVKCSIPLTDEDLTPGEVPRKSRAQFCVLMRGFNNLSQQATDFMYEAADKLLEGSQKSKSLCSNVTKKHKENDASISSPGSLYGSAAATPDCLNTSVTAKSCMTTQKLENGK